MSSDPRFLEAWVNRAGHRVFGRKLHPLCFLDMLALETVDSPFIPGSEGTPTAADFHLAVEILARPIRSLEVDDRIGKISWIKQRWYSGFDVVIENRKLQAYFDDYFTTLEMWRSDGAGKACQAPWILSQVSFLLSNTNLDEWRIWTGPVGQMLCYAAAVEEQLSSSQVISEEELMWIKEQREIAQKEKYNGRS